MKASTLYPRSHPHIIVSSTTVSFHLPKGETEGEDEEDIKGEEKWEQKGKSVKNTRRLSSRITGLYKKEPKRRKEEKEEEKEKKKDYPSVPVEVPSIDETGPATPCRKFQIVGYKGL